MTQNVHNAPHAQHVNLLGVDYAHVRLPDGGDLYITPYGIPFAEHLDPANWYEREWFEQNREKLIGTSTVYRVRTRPVRGRSKDLVVKWCRVGEEVPFDTFTFTKFAQAEFNSPYEEFSLVMELRNSATGEPRIRTHKPLAIYVPAQRFKLWQTGRSQSRMELKKARFRDVELDIYRQYILIYEWVKGLSLPEALQTLIPSEDERQRQIIRFTEQAIQQLHRRGFRVLDMKPEHLIVRPDRRRGLLRTQSGELAYALVDFELLERTPEHERAIVAQRRATYLRHQKDRFAIPSTPPFPENLFPMDVLGVSYVCGPTESTQGMLWVVGRDPALFDYFLPERWRRTPRTKLSENNETHYTRTKDGIHLVWKVSRCGERPEADATTSHGQRMLEHGFNSPFEEFAIALELARLGFPTTYPRAIYMTGREASLADYHTDDRRYRTHQNLKLPDGHPVLRRDHNYIMVWGYWNGLDEVLATRDEAYCRGINLKQALKDGLITALQQQELLERAAHELAQLGFEDLDLKPSHFLLTLDASDQLVRDETGRLVLRMCHFSFVRRIIRLPPAPAPHQGA